MKSILNALHDGRLVELPDTDKERSLRYLSHLIEAIPELSGSIDLDKEVMARENSYNTGIGSGVACPHVRVAGNGDLLCAVGWSPTGIGYGSADGKKVHLVVMYYIPDSDKNTYLKEVSALASAVKKEGGLQAIAKAEDIATVREQLLDWVSAANEAGVPEAKARMVRLEARQAAVTGAEVVPGAAPIPLEILSVSILTMGENRHIVLCENTDLTLQLEKDLHLSEALNDPNQFVRAGYQFVLKRQTEFGNGRHLAEYLAIRKKI